MKENLGFIIIVMILVGAIIGVIIKDIRINKEIEEMVQSGKSTIESGPIQKIIKEDERETIDFKGVKITKIAEYDITGRVVGMEFYYFGGGANKISPQDLAICWGPAAYNKYSKDIGVAISNNDRFTTFLVNGNLLKNYGQKAYEYVSNNHIIPANNRLKSVLKKVKKGDYVQIQGYLVECRGENWKWGPSSLTRTDRGDGACEIIYAESIYIY